MHLDLHYTDPRLAAHYDVENAGRDDIEFYLALAAELEAESVVDLGCGTGVLAVDLAARGHHVTGVDPASAMLDVARSRPGGQHVTWVEGDAAALGTAAADLAVMTGHVAQVFRNDDEWLQALAAVHRALNPGGHIAFESRNPDAEGWTSWTRARSFQTFVTGNGESFDSWVQVTQVEPGVVTFSGHTVFPEGSDIVATSTLAFRARHELEASLADTGFVVRTVYGDWDRSQVTATSPELIIVARRSDPVQ